MISHEHRFIFVHIPKNAGNSFNRAFGIHWADHKDIRRYSQEMEPAAFETFFKFAVVRNPWDRILSDYNFQKKKRRSAENRLFLFTESGAMRSFSDWVQTAFADPFHYDGRHWGGEVSAHIHRWSPQVDWIQINGEIAVDFIARHESLEEDFRLIRQWIGLPHSRLPRRNRKFHWHYSHYFDGATRELVGNYYAQDIKTFGYEFEDRTRSVVRFFFGALSNFSWRSAERVLGPGV